ncbi:alpha/beta fold hydrolase [Sandarakinorhabdus sp. AAP62]|uniref:alpha/beta fold hydrolase n=1 Tax=Sandarakinorhabdus sp. AAP62 TaxID=1248916 RepID=UPI00036D0708|nr:alpha/beta fold hydrolase [Sandarakinorhabdus sp. AAP62]
MTMAAHRAGPSDAPVLVLLHAIATSSALWTPQLAALASRFHVVRIDLPGHGDSPAMTGSPGYPDYADAVAATLAGLGIHSASIAGLSFGAMVAMQLAVRHPALASRVALANCAAFTPPPVADMWRARIAAVEQGGMASQRAVTLDRWFTPGFAASAALTLDWIGSMIEATPSAGFIAAARMISSLDHRDILSAIASPTLVLSGAHDLATTPAIMAGIVAALPHAQLASLDAAHLANVEAPVAFAEALGAFMLAA